MYTCSPTYGANVVNKYEDTSLKITKNSIAALLIERYVTKCVVSANIFQYTNICIRNFIKYP